MSELDAQQVHEAVYQRLKTKLDGGFKTFRRTPMRVLQPEMLPSLAVYEMREQGVADGDGGPPSFMHTLHLGISAIIVDSNDDAQLDKLYKQVAQIKPLLFSCAPLVKMVQNWQSFDFRKVFPQVGETAFAEVQGEIVVTFHSDWEPADLDDLKVIHETVQFGTAATPKIETELEIEQSS